MVTMGSKHRLSSPRASVLSTTLVSMPPKWKLAGEQGRGSGWSGGHEGHWCVHCIYSHTLLWHNDTGYDEKLWIVVHCTLCVYCIVFSFISKTRLTKRSHLQAKIELNLVWKLENTSRVSISLPPLPLSVKIQNFLFDHCNTLHKCQTNNLLCRFKIGMLIENRKSGFKTEIRFSLLETEFRIYFF